jgi:hypothetical protein
MKKLLVTFMVALFATMVWGQAQTGTKPSSTQPEVKPTDLPKCITEWLAQNMKGYTVEKSYKIDQKGVITYVLKTVNKERATQWLEFANDCKNVKKISGSEAEKKTTLTAVPAPVPPKPLPPVKPKQNPSEPAKK